MRGVTHRLSSVITALALVGVAACNDNGTTPDTTAPTVQIQAPTAGFAVAGGTITVTGTASDDRQVSRIVYQVNGGAETPVSITAGTTAQFSFDVPLADGANSITVNAYDGSNNKGSGTVQGARDGQAPALDITTPTAGSALIAPSVTVSGRATDGVRVTRVTYRVNGGTETEVTVTPGASVDFSFSAALTDGANTVSVAAYDAVGNRTSVDRSVQRNPAGVAALSLQDPSGAAITDAQITGAPAASSALIPLSGPVSREVIYSPSGNFGFENLGNGNYRVYLPTGVAFTLTVTRAGFMSLIYQNVMVQQGATTFLEALQLIPSNQSSPGTASFQISDAFNGQALSGVALTMRAGVNATSGASVATATTDASGAASIGNLAAGYYTVEMARSGYSGGFFSISVAGGGTTTRHGSIAPAVEAGQIRVILDWGETPSDLDSHLTGPDGGSGRFHVYYGDDAYYGSGSEPIAALDHDDVTSFGPETITIYQPIAGVYRYSVHDYSNSDATSSTALAESGARVRVYMGANLVRTFFVPSNQGGTLWTVFELSGTTITPINTMTYQPSPGAVADRRHVDDMQLRRAKTPR